MSEPIQILLLANREEDLDELARMLPEDQYALRRQIMAPGGALEAAPTDVALRIVALPPDFEVVGQTEAFSFGVSPHPMLYVMSDPSVQARQWAYRRGAAEVLLRPFSDVELHYWIGRALASDRWRFERDTTEKNTLEFLQGLLKRSVRQIQPAADPSMPTGYFYPEVARIFGRNPHDLSFLTRLANEGALSETLVDRVRLCPQCSHSTLNFREICPHCDSIDIFETEAVHHFSCGHVAAIESFRKGPDLVCPKCQETLRHIGLDYEKPSQHFTCGECEFIFSDPKVEAECLRCGSVNDPAQTLARNIPEFEVTPLARQAVEEQQLSGMNLSKLLRNQQTGLYTRQFLEVQAEREFKRAKRHGTPFCVLMVRIKDLETIISEHPEQAMDYVNTIFTELSGNLRALDMTCVWGRDLLAVLLPDTPGEGADAVARRMDEGVRGLEYLYSIHEPRIEISAVAWKSSYEEYWEVFGEALKALES